MGHHQGMCSKWHFWQLHGCCLRQTCGACRVRDLDKSTTQFHQGNIFSIGRVKRISWKIISLWCVVHDRGISLPIVGIVLHSGCRGKRCSAQHTELFSLRKFSVQCCHRKTQENGHLQVEALSPPWYPVATCI